MPSLTKRLIFASAAAILIATPAIAADEADKADEQNCKIVERDPGTADNSGTLSSSVTAGGGKVSGHTSGGNTITMNSGGGHTSSSISTTTGSGGRHQTIVTDTDGNCTIYRDKEK